MQYAALLHAIRAQGKAIKRLNLNFPGGFPQANGSLPSWMGGMIWKQKFSTDWTNNDLFFLSVVCYFNKKKDVFLPFFSSLTFLFYYYYSYYINLLFQSKGLYKSKKRKQIFDIFIMNHLIILNNMGIILSKIINIYLLFFFFSCIY